MQPLHSAYTLIECVTFTPSTTLSPPLVNYCKATDADPCQSTQITWLNRPLASSEAHYTLTVFMGCVTGTCPHYPWTWTRLRWRPIQNYTSVDKPLTQPSTLRGTVKWMPAKGRWRSAAGKVTADLAESNGSLRPVGWLKSAAGWLPVHRDQLRAQRTVASMGSLYL